MSQALPIVGAVVGFFVGGPAGAQWGWAAGSDLGTSISSPTNQPQTETLNDDPQRSS